MPSAKQALRARMRRVRDSIAPDVAAKAAVSATELVLDRAITGDMAVVGVYASMRNELSTAPLIRELLSRKVTLAFPRVVAGQLRLAFHHVGEMSELAPSRIGIPEPSASAPVIPLERIDLFIVPGLAFDARGNRLGWGRGHYDVTLAENLRALRVGFSYECQIAGDVPSTPRDLPMDLVVTEARVRVCGRDPQKARQ